MKVAVPQIGAPRAQRPRPKQGPRAAERPRAGGSFARYQISHRIGVGGMGAVYEARHALLNKRVALKTLSGRAADDALLRRRFLREAEIGARVRHPHIVDVYDAGVASGLPFLVMELLQGEDLGAYLARTGPLTAEEAANLLLPVAAALVEVHRRGIVHCDVKPQNVFIAVDAQGDALIKLLDFGLSKDLPYPSVDPAARGEAAARRGEWPEIEGTPPYMAPEQLRGESAPDARSDQYALGVLLYQCLAGVQPFAAGSLLNVSYRVCTGQHAPLAALRPDLPAGLVALVARAMALDPARRFPSVAALGCALSSFASAETAAAYAREFVPERRSSAPSPRRSWLPPPRCSVASKSPTATRSGADAYLDARLTPSPAVAFLGSALLTAALMLAALVGWLCAEKAQSAHLDPLLRGSPALALPASAEAPSAARVLSPHDDETL